jgi:hypothetical protein
VALSFGKGLTVCENTVYDVQLVEHSVSIHLSKFLTFLVYPSILVELMVSKIEAE